MMKANPGACIVIGGKLGRKDGGNADTRPALEAREGLPSDFVGRLHSALVLDQQTVRTPSASKPPKPSWTIVF